ncbi:MAG: imidazole glycerol phosphate synthase subunit HisH [Rhodospirillaceae bacterium]|nr:imidazole glycerol phosphate synthase subunit HisH [Rhodospirillaceae bacterium]
MTVAIIDYGSGNLRSVAKAFRKAAAGSDRGQAVTVTAEPNELRTAAHIVLPGVGAFAECMEGLQSMDGMRESLDEQVAKAGKPFLGICVGMQLMAESGHEHTVTPGLGWLSGRVVPLAPIFDDRPLKVPHMGWNQLVPTSDAHPILDGIEPGSHVYFVHSYQMRLERPDALLATTDYGGSVTAVVGRDNLIGTQFHPEKSQANGLRLIRNFLDWRP